MLSMVMIVNIWSRYMLLGVVTAKQLHLNSKLQPKLSEAILTSFWLSSTALSTKLKNCQFQDIQLYTFTVGINLLIPLHLMEGETKKELFNGWKTTPNMNGLNRYRWWKPKQYRKSFEVIYKQNKSFLIIIFLKFAHFYWLHLFVKERL